MNNLAKFHRYFHWLYYDKNKSGYFQIGFSLFIWVFLALTQSFGIYNNNLPNYWLLLLFLLPFGFISGIFFLISDWVLINLLQIPANQDQQKDLVFWGGKVALLIHVFVLVRGMFCSWKCIDWMEYGEMWLAIGLMFALFYIPFAFYARYKFYKGIIGLDHLSSKRFELKGGGKKSIYLNLDEVIYFCADDNYVDIYSRENGEVKKSILRVTVKSVVSQLQKYPQFMRTHRGYIINLKFLSGKVEKQSVLLRSADFESRIPVSEKYLEELSRLIG